MDAQNIVSRAVLFIVCVSASLVWAQPGSPLNVINGDEEALPVLAHESESTLIAPERVTVVTKSANYGDPSSQVELGLYLMRTQHGESGARQAFDWFQRAASEESPAAMNDLAALYFEGRGVSRDPAAGLRWALRAASHQYAPAEMNVGFAHWYGWGTPVNREEALRWFQRSAKHGLSIAQCALGVLYERGDGVKPDMTEAAKWYDRAAKQGHPAALNNLAVMYEQGRGVRTNSSKAAEYYERAANAGLLLAATNRARLLVSGVGVQRNLGEACYWLLLAADSDPAAAPYTRQVCGSITPAQLDTVRRRVGEWQRAHLDLIPAEPALSARAYPTIFETSVPAANLTHGH